MKISVIGTGYVGLVTGVCLAEKGHEVICVDIVSEKVDMINRGQTPIYEPGLEELLRKNIGGSFSASLDLSEAVNKSEASFIAVGTPFDGRKIDLSYVEKCAQQIAETLSTKKSYHLVIVKSTVVPGTTQNTVRGIIEKYSGKEIGEFGLGMNPEFLREGCAVGDFMEPDRIVLGGTDEKSIETMEKIYAPFSDVEFVKVDCTTAEMIKYTANSLFAAMISFSNEIAGICESAGVDVKDVFAGVYPDRRLTPVLNNERIRPGFLSYLAAGCGFGGSCFPKDVKALISYAKDNNCSAQMLDSVIDINLSQPEKLCEKLEKHFDSLDGLKVTVLGLAFKPDTDDIRESPAIRVVEYLLDKGVDITAYDPLAIDNFKGLFPDRIIYADNILQSVKSADAVIVITSWKEFEVLPDCLRDKENPPLVIDGRRMYNNDYFARYDGIGM